MKSLTEITIPKTAANLVGEYIKFSPREMMDLAYVGVAVAYNLGDTDKKCDGVRIVLGAVAPTPIRAKRAEAALEGQVLTEALAEKVGQIAAEEAKPISDVRSSADYRRAMVGTMTKRALAQRRRRPGKIVGTTGASEDIRTMLVNVFVIGRTRTTIHDH